MEVQKFMKRLKFARADWSRNSGEFDSKQSAIEFLDNREFFFGDPFVVKYTENGETKLMLAIGKVAEPVVENDTVTGAKKVDGVDAYELFDNDAIFSLIEQLREELENIADQTSANTEAIENLIEQIAQMSGATQNLEEIVGTGFTEDIDITERIKRDEELAGITWGHDEGQPMDGHLPNTELPYASGSSIADMVKTISDTLNEVLFEDNGVTKAIEFDYNAGRNILYYTAGTQTGEIKLSQASIVDRAYYDSATEELVIIFNLGEGEEQEVRIPVGGLITEWETADTDTVKLHKERVVAGNDVLTAEVRISDDADNMLVAKSDGLYVTDSGLTKVENVLENVKDVLGLADDGHLPEGSFTGEHTQGLGTYLDAVNALDNAVSEAEATVASAMTAVDERLDESEEVTAIALNRLAEGVSQNANDIANLQEGAGNLDDALAQEIQDRIAGDMAAQGRCQMIQDQLDDEKGYRKAIKLVKINPEDFERLGIGDDVRDAYFLTEHMPGTTDPYTDPVPGQPIIKVYKDSVIYKIYFGHVDDELTSATDPTIIPGTGETAICFIYFDAEGNYALATNAFDAGEALAELEATVEEMQDVTSIALNRLAEAIVDFSGQTINAYQQMYEQVQNMGQGLDELAEHVQEGDEVTAIALNRLAEGVSQNANDIYNLQEGLDQEVQDRTMGDAMAQARCQSIQDQLDDEKEYRKAIKLVQLNNSQIVTQFGPDTNVKEAYFLTRHMPGSTQPYTDPQPGDVIIKVYEDPVYSLNLDPDNAIISLDWVDEHGQPRSSQINVSDFTKDSFLEGVQVVTHEGVQCLEFSFKTYDGEPVPIYIPLTDLAVIYSAGHGIDREELEDNQVITVKIDEFARKNYLAKSDNGLLVTGVTEEIQEAVDNLMEEVSEQISAVTESLDEYVRKDEVEDHLDSTSTLPVQNKVVTNALNDLEGEVNDLRNDLDELSGSTDSRFNELVEIVSGVTGETLSEYVRKDEVEDHLDSASTLPVQNQVVTNALNDLVDQVEEMIENMTAITANTVITNELTATTANIDHITAQTIVTEEITASTANIENLYGDNAQLNHITAETIVTEELTANTANIENLTANTIYADEYQNLPTGDTEGNYGIVTIDPALDSGSTNPVANSAVTLVILENEEVVAAALNDLNDRKADHSDVENEADARESGDQYLQQQIDNIVGGGLTGVRTTGSGNVITNIEKVGNDVVGTLGEIDMENITAQTINTSAFTANNAEIDNITAQTIVTEEITATTANIENLTAQTIVTEEITATTANIENLTAQTIVTEEITATTANIENLTANTIVTNEITATTANIENIYGDNAQIDNITAQTIVTEELTASTANIENLTANTIYADEYQNLPTGDTEGNYGIVTIDPALDSGSTNPVANSAVTLVILENEEVIAAALNDLNDRKADQDDLDAVEHRVTVVEEAIETLVGGGLTGVTMDGTGNVVTGVTKSGNSVVAHLGTVDTEALAHIDSASTKPVQSAVLYQVIADDEEAIAAALNDLNDRKADKTYVDNGLNSLSDALDDLADAVLTGVTTSGTGNVITGIQKDGKNVKATFGTVDVSSKVDTTAFTAYTASTLNDVTTAGTGSIVTNVEKDGDKVKVTKTNDLSVSAITANTVNTTGLTANTVNATGVTATTVSATTYNNLPTASTTNFGVVKVDDALSTASTNPVQNKVITQTIIDNELVTAAALNDLNNRKANIEDIPVSVNELDGYSDLALKTDLAGYLPLSGGTMTGNISGSTGNAIYMPGGFFQQSDERLKIFCGEIEGAVEKVKDIPTSYFYWRNMPDGPRSLGTSAQKVQEYFPEIVSGDDKLSVDYSKLAIVALAAVKELTAKVEELQNKIDELQK